MMRRLLLLGAVAGAMWVPASVSAQGAAAPAPAGRVVQETQIDRQTRQIATQLRCVVCEGSSVQDSPSPFAQEMRSVIREKLAEGMTPAEVKAFFVESYGEWVLLQPEPKGFNLLIYVLPVAVLLGGAGFVLLKARSWTQHAAAAEAPEETRELV